MTEIHDRGIVHNDRLDQVQPPTQQVNFTARKNVTLFDYGWLFSNAKCNIFESTNQQINQLTMISNV